MKKKNKETIVAMLALVALVLVTVGISYAAFTYIGQGQRENTITTGNLTFVYDESNKSGNGISIENATPTTDDLGSVAREEGNVFEFTVTASTKGAPIYYEIYVTRQASSTLPEKIIKTYLTEVQGEEETGVPNTLTNENINTYNKLGISQVPNQENGRTLYQEMIEEGQNNYSKTFRYRMWIADTATQTDENGVWKYNNMSFTVKVNVYASNEEIGLPIPGETDPNPPVLIQGYIPVVYSTEKSSWVKADTSSNWYDYSNQEWANAVTVTETNRETYMNASAGTPIPMDDINTMWVWIPRYEYMYTNLGTNYAGGTKEQPGEIKVKFIEGTGTTPSDSTNYKVHPAFTFGIDELEGLWYAKFETTGTLSSACANTTCNVSTVTIKPGISSLRGQTVSSFFYMARSMQMNNASTYGFSTTDSDLHMSKNSEWGAVSYLSQSKYGKYGNPNYEGREKQVRFNSCGNPNFKTGIGADSQKAASTTATCTTNTYETTNGMAASTTGNITGIYDMSGGTYEYVMGVLADPSGKPRSGQNTTYHSGFTGMLENGSTYTGLPFPDEKYYNLYTSSSPTSYTGSLNEKACNGGICFGHALSETGGWYGDTYNFVYVSGPWFVRGGDYGGTSSAGVFHSSCNNGYTNSYYSSRLVIVSL